MSSNNNTFVARTVESSVAQIVSLVLSKEEYEKLLRWLDVEVDHGKSGAAQRLLVPHSNLVDSDLTDDVLTFETNSVPNNKPHVHSIPHTVRSHTRFFLKLYFLILGVKNGRAIYSRKGRVWATLTSLSFKDGSAASAAFALAGIALFYKLSYRLLRLLQYHLSTLIGFFDQNEDLKPKFVEILRAKSKLVTSIAAALISGSMFRYFPQDAGRDVITVYALVRAIETSLNYLNTEGYITAKSELLSSWALYPFAFSQVLHSFFFNPETIGTGMNRVLFKLSDDFFPDRPKTYSPSSPWPGPEQIVAGIAKVSSLNYPKFKSTIMFSNSLTSPDYLDEVKPVLLRAHPKVQTLIGAMTHPFQPSMFATIVKAILNKYNSVGKYILVLYIIKGFMEIKNTQPKSEDEDQKIMPSKYVTVLVSAIAKTVRTTTFIVMSTATAWAGIDAAQKLFSPSFFPMFRYKIIGFLAGLWAFVDKHSGGWWYLYVTRVAILSYWRVLVKENRVKPVRNGDVYLFVTSFAILMSLFEKSPKYVSGSSLRKVLFWIKNGDFKDPVFV